jgi:hypothetical protein
MADPYRKVQRGEPVKHSAAQWNAFVDAARAVAQGELDRASGQPTTHRDAAIVRVRNESGADLARGAVLGLGDPIFPPATTSVDIFAREVTFRGAVPAAGHTGKFAVLLDAAKTNRVIRAVVAGVCAVKITVTDAAHGYAEVAAGQTGYLASGSSGLAQILWKETGTGLKWAIVRLGGGSGGGRIAFTGSGGIPPASLAGGVLTPGTATVTLFAESGGGWALGAETFTAYHVIPGFAVAGDTVIQCKLVGARWVVDVEACPAGDVTTPAPPPPPGPSDPPPEPDGPTIPPTDGPAGPINTLSGFAVTPPDTGPIGTGTGGALEVNEPEPP